MFCILPYHHIKLNLCAEVDALNWYECVYVYICESVFVCVSACVYVFVSPILCTIGSCSFLFLAALRATPRLLFIVLVCVSWSYLSFIIHHFICLKHCSVLRNAVIIPPAQHNRDLTGKGLPRRSTVAASLALLLSTLGTFPFSIHVTVCRSLV